MQDLKIDKDFRISFDKALKPQILQAFNKKVDKDSFILDDATGKRVLTQEGEEIKVKDFGGVLKGSVIFVKSDLMALVSYLTDRENGIR